MNRKTKVVLLAISIMLSACAPKIVGTVQLFDANMKPVADESPEGVVINMINTTAEIEMASHSVKTDKEGKFESEPKAVTKGTYKVEARKMGFETETETLEVTGGTKKVDFKLKKIIEGSRRSLGWGRFR